MLMKKLIALLLCLSWIMLAAVPRNLVVVEVATGTWCQYCPGAAMGCHDLLLNGHPVAIIKNHNGDAYANTYSNARNSFYGISAYPTAKFDGIETYEGGNVSSSIYSSYLPKVNARLAIPAKYTINAIASSIGDQYTAQVTVAKPEEDSNTNMKLHAVLTQSGIAQVWFNQTTVENVNRLMIPDQNGTPISLSTGGETTVEINFTKQASWVTDDCELVFFLQNMTTKEILQAKKYTLNEITGGYPLSITSHNYSFSPVGGTSSTAVTIQNYAAYAVSGTISTDNSAFTPSVIAYSIAAYGSQTFNVSFNPDLPQDYAGNLLLDGNLWNYPNISVPLSGIAYMPASDFTFVNSPGTYVPVTGGTVLGSTTTRGVSFVNPAIPLGSISTLTGPGFPIGFDLNYLGRSFDRLAIHSNGWISLGQSTLNPSVNLTSTSLNMPISSVVQLTPPHLVSRISALAWSLHAQAGAEIMLTTIGEAPNRECVIQWTNYRRINTTGDSFNFQIRLLENGNRIRFVYGDFSFSGTGSLNMDVGFRSLPDTEATNFYNLTTTTDWANPETGSTISSRMTLSAAVLPASGTIYTWIPRGVFTRSSSSCLTAFWLNRNACIRI